MLQLKCTNSPIPIRKIQTKVFVSKPTVQETNPATTPQSQHHHVRAPNDNTTADTETAHHQDAEDTIPEVDRRREDEDTIVVVKEAIVSDHNRRGVKVCRCQMRKWIEKSIL